MHVPRTLRSPYTWIVSVFALSRALYFAAGVRFDSQPLNRFFQFLDPELMRHRLFESLFYMHTQPPGFNLVVGLVVKLFPYSYTPVLHALYLLCGLSLCFTLYRLLEIFGVRPWLAATLTAFFLASPGVVLFENMLLYEYPLMALFCASAVVFHRLLERPSPAMAVTFFASLAAFVYLRALFHLAWFVLLAAFTVWLLRGHRKMILAAAAVPFALVLALYVKNWFVFSTFSSSTWMGFNIATITLGSMSDEEKARLIDSGLISRVSAIPAPSALPEYRLYIHPVAKTGIPVLDQEFDSTGRPNFNNIAYFQVHQYYLRDGKALLLHYPQCYLRSMATAWFAYFLPSGDFIFFTQNRPRIFRFDRLFNILFFGQWKDASDRKELRRLKAEGKAAELPLYTGTYLMIGLPLLFLWGVLRLWRQGRTGWRQPTTALLAFLLFNIAYLTAVVNLLSSFENNRYRLPLDPFFVVLFGAAIESLLSRKCASPQTARPSAPPRVTLERGRMARRTSLTFPAFLLAVATVLAMTYADEIERWREKREASLKADGGWLTVAGLFWLHEGANTAGADHSNEIVLPRGPAHAGVFELHGGVISFQRHGEPRAIPLKPDASDSPDLVQFADLTLFAIVRGKRYGIRLKDKQSELRRNFTGLHWYPVREEYRVTAKWVAYAKPKPMAVPNVLGDTEQEPSPATRYSHCMGATRAASRARRQPVVLHLPRSDQRQGDLSIRPFSVRGPGFEWPRDSRLQ